MTEEEKTVRELMRYSANPAKEIANYIIESNDYIKKVWYTITASITALLITAIVILC